MQTRPSRYAEPIEYWPHEDKEKKVCKFFSCGATLTLEEQLCGDFCQLHSNLPKKMQPHGPEDPVLFVSY